LRAKLAARARQQLPQRKIARHLLKANDIGKRVVALAVRVLRVFNLRAMVQDFKDETFAGQYGKSMQ
jgi:hypothetical protein